MALVDQIKEKFKFNSNVNHEGEVENKIRDIVAEAGAKILELVPNNYDASRILGHLESAMHQAIHSIGAPTPFPTVEVPVAVTQPTDETTAAELGVDPTQQNSATAAEGLSQPVADENQSANETTNQPITTGTEATDSEAEAPGEGPY